MGRSQRNDRQPNSLKFFAKLDFFLNHIITRAFFNLYNFNVVDCACYPELINELKIKF